VSSVFAFLGASLLHSLWLGIPVGLAWWGAKRWIGPGSARRRCLAAAAALGCLALLPFAASALLPTAPVSFVREVTKDRVVSGNIEQVLVFDEEERETLPRMVADLEQERSSLTPFGARIGRLRAVLAWLGGLWALACLIGMARVATSARRLWRALVANSEAIDERSGARFAGLARRMGLERNPSFRVASRLPGPATIGWRQPWIVLPRRALSQLSADELDAVVVHELEHVRRHDWLLALFVACIEAGFRFHPLCWSRAGTVRREREHDCDDRAVHECGSRSLYARTLAKLEEQRVAAHALSVLPDLRPALGAIEGQLLDRVRRLATSPAREANRSGRLVGAVGMAAAGLILLTGTLAALQVETRAPRKPPGHYRERIVLDDGASTWVRERLPEGERCLRIRRPAEGTPHYEYHLDGREAPVDDEVLAWMEALFSEVGLETESAAPSAR
jgi:beta-lactamase regulating signal transducer with metallopeptidase domain